MPDSSSAIKIPHLTAQRLQQYERQLVETGIELTEVFGSLINENPASSTSTVSSTYKITDFGFIIFPVAKAYEGYLKEFLQGLHILPISQMNEDNFRIGRALNPDIRPDQRDKWWLYDDVEEICGRDNSRQIWNTWIKCRNQVFHYFPEKEKITTYQQARASVLLLLDTMEIIASCLVEFQAQQES